MMEYLVFFGLFAVGILVFVLHERQDHSKDIWGSPFKREIAKCESPIERRLFGSVYRLRRDVITQYKIGSYRADFAIPSLLLVIEADGIQHTTPDRKRRDRKRDRYLKSRGWETIRFTGSEINGNIKECQKRIENVINERSTLFKQ